MISCDILLTAFILWLSLVSSVPELLPHIVLYQMLLYLNAIVYDLCLVVLKISK